MFLSSIKGNVTTVGMTPIEMKSEQECSVTNGKRQ